MRTGKITKTEWLLLGMTGLFLCVLLGLFLQDRRAQVPVETEVQVAQEELVPDLSPLNPNRATAEELAELPGIGAELADRVVAYREERGGFGSVEEIMEVSGIGEGKLAALEGRITVEDRS